METDMRKVFIIGFHKTGTTSLELALQYLGYRVYGGDKNLLKFNDSSELKDYIKNVLTNWDAVQDMPWPIFYNELYDLYPEAKFILTYRDPDKWISSVRTYFASIKIPLHRKIYGVPCAEGNEDVYLKRYEQHNDAVMKFFKGKENFICMRQGEHFSYEILCNFLGIQQIPNLEFPHARNNGLRVLPKYRLYRDIRSTYWNWKKNY